MTYASANRRPSPAALAGAFGIPGAFGALLIAGLAVTVVTVPDKPNPQGRIIDTVTLPPPPPQPDTPPTDKTVTTTPIPNPIPETKMPPIDGPIIFKGPVIIPTNPTDTGGPIVTGGIPGPVPSASLYTPVGARPKGNAGRWVTNDDYRTRWIMEEMEGTARFALSIDANGKVSGCTITRSTGHAPLDTATCDLLSKRARFDAARDSTGKAVPGNYSGSVTWRIPE